MVKIHKVIVVGDKQTGKTSLIMKYLDGVFPNNPQLDSSSKRKEVTIGNEMDISISGIPVKENNEIVYPDSFSEKQKSHSVSLI